MTQIRGTAMLTDGPERFTGGQFGDKKRRRTPKKENSIEDTDHIDRTITPSDAAEYIAAMLKDLQDMAGTSGMTFLAYLIQVAIEEAKIQGTK